MFIYKNISLATKTFYGVTFKPGDVKEVKGPINHPRFIRVTTPAKLDTTSTTDNKKSDKQTEVKSNSTGNKQNSKDEKQGGNS